MIDLHMHTIHSDGTENCTSILKKCEEKKLDYIAITDHNTVDAYFELENINIKDYFSGKIICGVELNTKILNVPIEILGYGILYRQYMSAPNAPLYVEMDDLVPDFKTASSLIQVNIGNGFGNLQIPTDIISNWVTKINLFN